MRRMRHATLGRCMYCLATRGPLTEEHLIPRSLGGRLTLRDAVCEPCRRITGRLEQATLAREFAVPKTLLALKRRRARGKGPSQLPPVILQGDDAATTLAAADFPRTFPLPVFERAGLLVGTDRTTAPPRTEAVACTLALGTPTRRTVAATLPLADPTAYGYAIAKWAYALAVAERGLDAHDMQPLRDLMLGRRDDVFAFVGNQEPVNESGASERRVQTCPIKAQGTAGVAPPASSCNAERARLDVASGGVGFVHRLSSQAAARDALHEASMHEIDDWVTLRLALFASAGMQPYEIVIARQAAARA